MTDLAIMNEQPIVPLGFASHDTKTGETQICTRTNPEPQSEGPAADFVRSAIRQHALDVSTKTRNGKFSRVSQEFVQDIIAEIEGKLATLRTPPSNAEVFGAVEPEVEFLTGAGKKKLAKCFNTWVASTIYRKVQAARIGKTL
jgi:hypothetical protein